MGANLYFDIRKAFLKSKPHSPDHHRRSARDVLGVFATRVAMYPLVFAVGILVARALGPSDRGIYAFLGLITGFLLPFLTFGFGASVIYFISNDRYQAQDVALTCAVVGALQGVLCASIAGSLWMLGWFGETARQTSGWYLLPFLLLLPFQGASLMVSRIFLGTSWFKANNLLSLLSPILTAVLMLILVVIFHLGLRGAVAAGVATGLITGVCNIVVVWIKYQPHWSWNGPFLLESLRYGIKAWLGDLAVRMNLRLDQFVLGIVAAPAALGTYTVAVSVSEVLWILPDSLAVVTFNKLAAEKNQAARIRLVGVIHRVLWLVVGSAALALAVLGWWLVPVAYGAKFADASWFLLLLLPGTVAMTTAKVITKYFGASGLPGQSSIIQAIGAAVSMVGYLVLIPRYGAVGAAISSTAGYATAGLTAYVLYRRAIRPASPQLASFRAADLRWLYAQASSLLPKAKPTPPVSA